MPSAKDIIYLFLELDLIDFIVDKSRVNLNCDCASYFGHLWSYKKFCKKVNLPMNVYLFKLFQILEIVYILEWKLYK